MGMSNGVGTIAGIVCPIVTEMLTKHRVSWFSFVNSIISLGYRYSFVAHDPEGVATWLLGDINTSFEGRIYGILCPPTTKSLYSLCSLFSYFMMPCSDLPFFGEHRLRVYILCHEMSQCVSFFTCSRIQ